MRSGLAIALAGAALVAPVQVRADDAEALYNRGLEEMQAGRYATACPLLAESERMDPQPGALFTLAECEAKWGRLATALARYEEYLVVYARLPPAEQRAQQARQSAAVAQKISLASQVPRLTLVLPPSAPRGTVVERDGRIVDPSELGAPAPIDPGEHVVGVRVPGGREQRQTILLAAGDVKRVELVVEPGAETHATKAETPRRQPASPASSAGTGSIRRPLAFALGGLGIAGVVVGAVTGGLAASKKSTIGDNCDGRFCNQDGLDAARASQSFATASNIAFGVGVVALGAAVVLLLTEPAEKRTAHR